MKTYCEHCKNFKEYYVKTESIERIIKSIDYSFQGKIAFCAKCHKKVGVNSILDYNAKQLEKVVNLKKGEIKNEKNENII